MRQLRAGVAWYQRKFARRLGQSSHHNVAAKPDAAINTVNGGACGAEDGLRFRHGAAYADGFEDVQGREVDRLHGVI